MKFDELQQVSAVNIWKADIVFSFHICYTVLAVKELFAGNLKVN
jgi:hypothetical protein